MDILEVEDLIEQADKCRDEIVLCLLGNPGIGKTEAVYNFAKKNNRNVVEIIASQILPNEVSGITMPVNETKSMEIFDHARLSSLKDGDILFFDELLEAAPSTLSACLTLIQERRLMSGKMLPDVLIIAASNPLASPDLIKDSIKQRFMFVEVNFNYSNYKKYMEKKFDVLLPNKINHILFEKDTTGYNTLTPRSLTKIVKWILNTPQEDRRTIECYLKQTYGTGIAKTILETINLKQKYEADNYLDAAKNFVNTYLSDKEHPVLNADRIKEQVSEADNATQLLEIIRDLSGIDYARLRKELEEISIDDIILSEF